MAITPASLLAPAGPVEATLFPDEDQATLEARLQAYIDKAQSKVAEIAFPDPSEAVEAWALHLTFEAAFIVAAARPNNENTMVPVLGSTGYAKDQRDALKAKSLEYKNIYLGLLGRVPTAAQPLGPQTRQSEIRYEW